MERLRLGVTGSAAVVVMRSDRAREVAFDISMTLASLIVLVLGALYITAPPIDSMAVEVSETTAATDGIILYGTVGDTEGKTVRSATLVVSRQSGNTLTRVATVPVASDGTFHAELPGTAGTYRLVASIDVGGTTVSDTITVDMEPGTAYGFSIELVTRDYFLFLPIGSY